MNYNVSIAILIAGIGVWFFLLMPFGTVKSKRNSFIRSFLPKQKQAVKRNAHD